MVGTVGTDEEVGALSGDAHLFVTATRSRARVWDVATHRVVGTFATGGRTPMHFTPDGILFKAPQGGQAQIRRTDGRVVRTFSGDLDPEFVSPLGTLLVGETTSGPATDSPQVVVYRTTAGTPLVRRVPLPAGTDMCLATNAFGPRSFVMTCLLKSTGTSTPAARAYEVDYSGGAARPLSPARGQTFLVRQVGGARFGSYTKDPDSCSMRLTRLTPTTATLPPRLNVTGSDRFPIGTHGSSLLYVEFKDTTGCGPSKPPTRLAIGSYDVATGTARTLVGSTRADRETVTSLVLVSADS